MLAFDAPIPPGLNLGVDLLVEVRHRARAHMRAPERLGDVLHPSDRNARQIHLDQHFLDGAGFIHAGRETTHAHASPYIREIYRVPFVPRL